MLRTAFFRLLLFVAFIGAADAAQAQKAETWTSVRSEHFSITGNASANDLRAAAMRLEQFRWSFSQLYPRLKLDNGLFTNILIFRDAESYFTFLPKRSDGTTDVGVEGYYQAGEDTNYITLAIDQRQSDPFSTAVHEYVHSLIDANFDRSSLPPWLNEGLAEYFETLQINTGPTVLAGAPQPDHRRLLRRIPLMPTQEFIGLTAADLKTISPERRRAFYAQSWATVHWLIQNDRLSLDGLPGTLARLSASGFESVFRIGYTALDTELRTGIDGPPPLPKVIAVLGQYSAKTASAETIPLSKAYAVLGDLLSHTGELSRSEEFLRAALAADSRSTFINAAMGLLLSRQQRTAEAVPFLEKAVADGSANHLVYFYLAFNLMKGGPNDQKADISDDAARNIRTFLKRSIELRPVFAESYRLLALLDYLRDENLDEAAVMVQKGLSYRPDDNELKLLEARILLRREDVGQAKKIAEELTASAADVRQRTEAGEIVKAADEYTKANMTVTLPIQLTIGLADKQSIVVLKRSWLTADEVNRVDEDRINNNLNRIIIRPRTGEQQVVGSIERIACANNGSISYRIRTEKGNFTLSSTDFAKVKMTVAREGESTFQIGCGAILENEMAVLNYLPAALPANGPAGELTAISFVPETFRLKSLQEMTTARLVAVEDDTLKRSGGPTPVTSEMIHNSVLQYIRKPQKDETRTNGTIQKIECSAGMMFFDIATAGKHLRLAVRPTDKTHVGWFTVASSQLSLSCGGGPFKMNTLISYKPVSENGTDGDLRSIEFVPEGFIP